MKNYLVSATRVFTDKEENRTLRKVGDTFYCTKERYEHLKSNNAVSLVEIKQTIIIEPKEVKPIKLVEEEMPKVKKEPKEEEKKEVKKTTKKKTGKK